MTYGQKAEGIKNYKDFESRIAKELERYVFLNWQNRKTLRLCKSLYSKGYTVSDAVSFIILQSGN